MDAPVYEVLVEVEVSLYPYKPPPTSYLTAGGRVDAHVPLLLHTLSLLLCALLYGVLTKKDL